MKLQKKHLTLLSDPLVPDPLKACGPYDLTPTVDRCINCGECKKIKAIITLDQRSGPCCYSCLEVNKIEK